MGAMYFSRPQAFIFIAGLMFLWLLLKFGLKRSLIWFLGLGVFGIAVDKYIIYPLSFKYPLTPIIMKGRQLIFTYSSNSAVSDFLRGAARPTLDLSGILTKVFYNLYNFYKALPEIASPYMWGLFVIGLFSWGKSKLQNSFKISVILVVLITFLVTAFTIPFFRYLHPVVPLVYLIATTTLVWIIKEIVNSEWSIIKRWPLIKKFKKEQIISGISCFLIVFFVAGQTLGVIFLDSRFKARRTNRNKPPVYVQLSWILRDNTNTEDLIVTNLDTWGSWYGERKTIWFPIKPDQLASKEGQENPFDVIYLTDYLMDDENYYMGDEWRQIFYNPEDPENEYIAENYELKEIFEINAKDVYEKQNARAVLLTRKTQ
jgi:hypothetical protein